VVLPAVGGTRRVRGRGAAGECDGTDALPGGAGEQLDGRAEEDSEADHPELRAAWRLVLEAAHEKETADGRRTATTLVGRVKYTLEFLAGHGLLVGDGDEAFRTTRALLTQLRELAANEAFALVRGVTTTAAEAD